MFKLTLSVIMLIMKYQGNKGKYYTVQKASFLISGIFSLCISMLLKRTYLADLNKHEFFTLFLSVWFLLFLGHYTWFLNTDKSKVKLHYKEFKKYLQIAFGVVLLTCLLFIL